MTTHTRHLPINDYKKEFQQNTNIREKKDLVKTEYVIEKNGKYGSTYLLDKLFPEGKIS